MRFAARSARSCERTRLAQPTQLDRQIVGVFLVVAVILWFVNATGADALLERRDCQNAYATARTAVIQLLSTPASHSTRIAPASVRSRVGVTQGWSPVAGPWRGMDVT